MMLRIQTVIPLPAQTVWERLRHFETLEHITKGLIRFQKLTPIPELTDGARLKVRFWFFHVVPAPWVHDLKMRRYDSKHMEMVTEEGGGFIKVWNHTIRVQKHQQGSFYTDEVEIRAGLMTPIVYAYSWMFYHYRQWRWRRWAAQDSGASNSSRM